jgi:hypothetical protein
MPVLNQQDVCADSKDLLIHGKMVKKKLFFRPVVILLSWLFLAGILDRYPVGNRLVHDHIGHYNNNKENHGMKNQSPILAAAIGNEEEEAIGDHRYDNGTYADE